METEHKRYVILPEFKGGLGNQLFAVASVLSIAKSLNRNVYIVPAIKSSGYTLSPAYTNSILQKLVGGNKAFPLENLHIVSIQQFEYIPPSVLDCEEHLMITGLPMHWDYVKDVFPQIVEYFGAVPASAQSVLSKCVESYISKKNINIAVCDRQFTKEDRPDWIVSTSYFVHAIKHVLEKLGTDRVTFHLFSDNVSVMGKWLGQFLYSLFGKSMQIHFYNGSQKDSSDVIYYYLMTYCDHFVLTNSTYHYWPCLIKCINKGFSNVHVTWPRGVDWLRYIVAPEWTGI